jgi:hypothetical protein
MSNQIALKRATAAGAVPGALADGEIAINEFDGKLFYKSRPSGAIKGIPLVETPGGLTLITEVAVTATVAAVELSGSWNYRQLLLVGENLSPSSTPTNLRMAISDDNGATWETIESGGFYRSTDMADGGPVSFGVSSLAYMSVLTASVSGGATQMAAANDDHCFMARIHNANAANGRKLIEANGVSFDAMSYSTAMGRSAVCNALNRLKLTYSTGSIDATGAAGKITLYGVA